MAEPESIISDITTTDFGKMLEKEYWGEDKDPSASINYFMVMFGKPLLAKKEVTEDDFFEILKKTEIDVWRPLENDGWKTRKLLFFKYDKDKTERKQEQKINDRFREILKEYYTESIAFKDEFFGPLPDIGIIFTRACLYTQKPYTISHTNHIGAILKRKYPCEYSDIPIDYFYLIIQEENEYPDLHKVATEEVKELQQSKKNEQLSDENKQHFVGEWKELHEDHWPGVFFGYYPKTAFMTEREREWSLNENVQKPLIENIEKEINETEAQKPDKQVEKTDEKKQDKKPAKVHIIITRACWYTAIASKNPEAQEPGEEEEN